MRKQQSNNDGRCGNYKQQQTYKPQKQRTTSLEGVETTKNNKLRRHGNYAGPARTKKEERERKKEKRLA